MHNVEVVVADIYNEYLSDKIINADLKKRRCVVK